MATAVRPHSFSARSLADRARSTPIVPALAVITLSDSFADYWPELARSCGFDLVMIQDPTEMVGQVSMTVLIAGGGVEEQLEETVRRHTGTGREVVAVGALPNHRIAATVVRAGAAEFFALPGDVALLQSWLRERADKPRQDARRADFAESERAKYRFTGILGDSQALRAALARASRVIPHPQVTVLLTGETGTGKELVARAIHYNGPRRDKPFVDVNCAALPEHLLESELFGHEKGAFTDASAAKPGLFELANGGTLFLDEIGHLPLPLQGKLLRALEERTVRRVGGTKNVAIDVRIVAATHVDLAGAVKRGEFREDLFYRLNVVPVELPALRHRREDILPLARHFLTKYAADYGLPVPNLTAAAERELTTRSWAGNVRELRNLIERSTLLSVDGVLDREDILDTATTARSPVTGGLVFPATMGELQISAAREMMELCGNNKSEAARRLGISRPRLQRLLDATSASDVEGGSDED